MKKFIKFLAFFSLAFLIMAIFLFWFLSYKYNDTVYFIAERKNLKNNEFIFIGQQPYGKFKIGNYSGVAVIDTGATVNSIDISSIDKRHLKYVKNGTGTTIFSTSTHEVYKADEFYVLGRKASNNEIHVSENGKFNLIGCPEIFSRDKVLISRAGLFYDDEIDSQVHGLNKKSIKVSVDRAKDGYVYAVYLQILINGLPERVLLDTGISDLLTSTGSSVIHKDNEKTKIKLIGTAESNHLVMAKSHSAEIQIGDKKLNREYLVIENWINPRAKFYLGSEVLNYYSLYFDFKRNEYFLFDVKNLNSKNK